jgi:hypothetical protein
MFHGAFSPATTHAARGTTSPPPWPPSHRRMLIRQCTSSSINYRRWSPTSVTASKPLQWARALRRGDGGALDYLGVGPRRVGVGQRRVGEVVRWPLIGGPSHEPPPRMWLYGIESGQARYHQHRGDSRRQPSCSQPPPCRSSFHPWYDTPYSYPCYWSLTC